MISYNIHKCLYSLSALLPVIGFGLEILWSLYVANITIFCEVAPCCSADGTSIEKEPSASTLIVKHFTLKTEPANFYESLVTGYQNAIKRHILEDCNLYPEIKAGYLYSLTYRLRLSEQLPRPSDGTLLWHKTIEGWRGSGN